MNLYEFLTHSDVQLPMTWASQRDFEEFVRSRFDTYLRLIDQLDSNSEADYIHHRKPAIRTCCDEICQSLRRSFEGHPHEAYQSFDSAVNSILPEINALAFKCEGSAPLGILYRVRQTQTPMLTRNDLFHIPFELRHLVATQRYSIPGLPCLYLAGSLYTCWEEMGRPPFHELQCAAFWVKNGRSLKLLNFSNRPVRQALLASPPGRVPAGLSNQIILWPLVFASSIVVKHRLSPFKPEYTIPQMILQWVTHNHGFDGLAYFSTNVRSVSKKHPMPISNIVLPAKVVTAYGRCARLCDTFKMTDPIGWQLLSSIELGDSTVGYSIPTYDLEFVDGVEEAYYRTQFGLVQMRLNKLVARTTLQNRDGDMTAGDILAS